MLSHEDRNSVVLTAADNRCVYVMGGVLNCVQLAHLNYRHQHLN